MNIYTLNLKNEKLLAANMSLMPMKSLTELKKISSAALPDLILIDEEYAEELIQHVQATAAASGDELACDVVVLVENGATTTIRRWTSVGAKTAWPKEEWEENLMEVYGADLTAYAHENTKQYNNKTPMVIAVSSSFKGNGGTHTALMIGKYLERTYRAKVAVVECSPEANAFTMIRQLSNGLDTSLDTSLRFVHQKMTLICSGLDASTQESLTRTGDYDYLVLDCGVLSESDVPHLFFNADLPILLGSGNNWRVLSSMNTLKKFSSWHQQDVRIVLPMGTKENRTFVSSVLKGRMVLTLSAQGDPFALGDEVEEELSMILAPILPKVSKRPFWALR